MYFTKEKVKDFYLLDSKVENVFINEYMPGAPGDYVKVFIYGAMYAEHEMEMTNATIAKQFGMTEAQVMEAWTYWEKMGAIRKHYIDSDENVNFSVEFVSLKELLYGKKISDTVQDTGSSHKNIFGNEEIKKMLSSIEKTMGKTMGTKEITTIFSWIEDYNGTPEVVLAAVKHCVEREKNSINYMDKVVKEWTSAGYTTTEQVKQHLQEIDQKYYKFKRVFKALGFNRNATEAEAKMMGKWFDDMGYSLERVLEACEKTSGISSPNINYVNRVLENWKNEAENSGGDVNKQKVVTRAVLNKYYAYLRKKEEVEAENRRKQVYEEIPRIQEIDIQFRELSSQLSKALLTGNGETEGKKINRLMDELSVERAVTLTDHNLEMDYTDIKYRCDECKDTGITDLGERCSCISKRTEEAEVWIKENENGMKQ